MSRRRRASGMEGSDVSGDFWGIYHRDAQNAPVADLERRKEHLWRVAPGYAPAAFAAYSRCGMVRFVHEVLRYTGIAHRCKRCLRIEKQQAEGSDPR